MATNLVRMHKCTFHIWRFGLILGSKWISWYNGLHIYNRNDAASSRSHSYNFFNA